MKTIGIITALFFSSIAFAQQGISFTFDGNTTLNDMQMAKMKLTEAGYLFNIVKMEFNSEGKLRELSIKVVAPDGSKASASETFTGPDNHIKLVHNRKEGEDLCVGKC